MINTRTKGRNAEKAFAQHLITQGFIVELVKGSTKFSKQVDFFGEFDLIALSSERIWLVQVKCNQARDARARLKAFLLNNPTPPFTYAVLAIKYDRISEWKVYFFRKYSDETIIEEIQRFSLSN